MSCISANNTPMTPERFPSKESWKEGYHSFLKCSKITAFSPKEKLPYKVDSLFRIFCVVSLTIFMAVFFSLSLSNLLVSSTLSLSNPALIVATVLPLYCITSAMLVFAKIICKKDIFTNTPINPFSNRYWLHLPHVRAYQTSKETQYHPVFPTYVDTSTLDKNGSGIACGYYFIREGELRLAHSVLQMIAVPLEVIAKIVYHVFRFLIIPFYIIYKMVKSYFSQKKHAPSFCPGDIFKEQARSIYYILRAPGYGAAHLIALFYSFIDPLAGRLAISCVERDWNDDIIRSRGLWLVKPERNFIFEGGGEKGSLSKHSFYLMGCLQPAALFLFENGSMVSATVPSAQSFSNINISVYPI
ncbi:hypothetical protein [Chlamydiifrater phoenicopteri]|uniref:hypothetical protein n=1 Tax=Chlamydiifrater phoenicopteri TaxID=2681469 RepID=UPI001BCD7048|nr:hypothetical protein [Chlamydiifrater phoenicopteri]